MVAEDALTPPRDPARFLSMATPHSPAPRGDALVDSAPLLGGGDGLHGGALRRPSLRGAARLLRQGERWAMRQPSLLVREAAAEHLEERQADWAPPRSGARPALEHCLRPRLRRRARAQPEESPSVPLRFWIVGYAAQCILHMVCVAIEYRMRRTVRRPHGQRADVESGSDASSSSNDGDDGERRPRGRNCDCVR
jgi:hypothetical protein